MKKLKKENFLVLKQLAMMVTQLGSQFQSLTPEMVQQYLDSPESPLKVNEMIEENLAKVCAEYDITGKKYSNTVNDFNLNMEQYKEEADVKKIRDEFDRDFQTALKGRLPQVNVKIPDFLTKEMILEIENKLTKSTFAIMKNDILFKSMPSEKSKEKLSNS